MTIFCNCSAIQLSSICFNFREMYDLTKESEKKMQEIMLID